MDVIAWLYGLAGSTLIAGLAYWRHSLSVSGAAAAIIAGTLLYALGSPAWYGTLLAFFLSSSFLSRWKETKKTEMNETYEKGARRDAGQVAANGSLAVIFCLLHAVWPLDLWWAAFVGAIAAVNADTWATEIGALSRMTPRSILTGQRVPAGTSGGITLLGLAAAAMGGLFIGAVATVLAHWEESSAALTMLPSGRSPLIYGALGGFLGALADSYIGARWQMMYQCISCGKELEQQSHCGQPCRPSRGIPGIHNDQVNWFCSLVGASAAAVAAISI